MRDLDYGLLQRWDDIRVAGSSVKIGAEGIPDFAQFLTNGSSSTGVYLDWFPNGNASQIKNVFFEVQLPHSYVKNTTIHPHIHWVSKTAVLGTVVWELEYTWSDKNLSFGTTTIIVASGTTSSVINEHMITYFQFIGTPLTNVSSMLLCRLTRRCDNAIDTYANTVGLLEFDFHILKNDLGSINE